ncbi:MAG: septal ring lytic transglycosylase RlpA family protein [Polaromonas sp.]
MCQGRFTDWVAAGLFLLLAGCAALPPPPDEPPVASAPVPVTAAEAPPARSLAKRFLERLHKPFIPPEVAPPPAAQTEPVADEKYLLTGEDARELERGHASWYGPRFHGRLTANGERYDKYALTAAHKTLPFGTIVRVRSLALGREVDVRINDRGPFAPGRVIDVSQAAAEALGLTAAGVGEVSLNVAESTLTTLGASARKKLNSRSRGNNSNSSRASANARSRRHSPPAKRP